VVAAHSVLAAGSTADAEMRLGRTTELLSSFNLMAMLETALRSVEIFAHPLFVSGQDTPVRSVRSA
jgi:hypothetical protein